MKLVDLEEYGFWLKIRILGLQNTDLEFSDLACLHLRSSRGQVALEMPCGYQIWWDDPLTKG